MTVVATWNVNSIKVRLPLVLGWLERAAPDFLFLQEIKCPTEAFPGDAFRERGYQAAVAGQKAYNGVAILSKTPLADIRTDLPGNAYDAQARYLEATTEGGVRLACLYAPNGNPVESEKFPYKLAWMDRLAARARAHLDDGRPLVMGGDFNIIPEDRDVFDPQAVSADALIQPQSRARWRTLLNLGLVDAFRACHGDAVAYSFWDYQGGAWPRNQGMRIDHILLSPDLADRLADAGIDRGPRGAEKASDHTPVWCRFRDGSR